MKITVKLALVFAASILGGCGGAEFGTDPFQVTAMGGSPGTGGALVEADGAAVGTGGATSTGGATVETGGSSATGGAATDDGGATGGSPATGGTTGTGGTTSTGGTTACTPVTHDNGLGQTWEDCVPLGTFNAEQALKACKASGATLCVDEGSNVGCGTTAVVWGSNGSNTITGLVGTWGYAGTGVGLVGTADCSAYCPCLTSGKTWN